jgi:hypothetical protein
MHFVASTASLTALFTMMSAALGILTYIVRLAWRTIRVLDGHLDALRANTTATHELSTRMDRVEAHLTTQDLVAHRGPA